MSVSSELLCSFELLKPLDTSALKHHIKKAKHKRQQMINSPVGSPIMTVLLIISLTWLLASIEFWSTVFALKVVHFHNIRFGGPVRPSAILCTKPWRSQCHHTSTNRQSETRLPICYLSCTCGCSRDNAASNPGTSCFEIKKVDFCR
jgi:hypothetical protein